MNSKLLKKLNNGNEISVLRLINKNGKIYAHVNVLAKMYHIKWTDENRKIISKNITSNTMMFIDFSYRFNDDNGREFALVECNKSDNEIHEGFRYWIDIEYLTLDCYGDIDTFVYRDNLEFVGVYKLSRFNVVK